MGRNGPHTWVLGVLVPMLGPIVTGVTPTYLPDRPREFVDPPEYLSDLRDLV